MSDEMYGYWLCRIKHLRRKTIEQMYREFGNARMVYEASEEQLRKCHFLTERELGLLRLAKGDTDWQKQWERIAERGVRVTMSST